MKNRKVRKGKYLVDYCGCLLLASVLALLCLILFDKEAMMGVMTTAIAWIVIPLVILIIILLLVIALKATGNITIDNSTTEAFVEPLASAGKSAPINSTPNERYYYYTGPKTTFKNRDWFNHDAYEKGLYETPTGSIHIKHPDLEMLCRVTDRENMPGFIINCKDMEGKRREFHVYYNEQSKKLTCCTSNETDKSLAPDDQIHGHRYKVPFVDDTYAKIKE